MLSSDDFNALDVLVLSMRKEEKFSTVSEKKTETKQYL